MPEIEVNGNTVSFRISPYNSKKSIPYYKNIILTSMARIGVTEQYIDVRFGGGGGYTSVDGWAEVVWLINGKEHNYKCSSQNRAVDNVAAIAQMIETDSKAIRRGLKTFGQVMSQFRLDFKQDGEKILSPREILGVAVDNKDWDYINFRYRRKCKELHPDSETGNAAKFKELQGAFEDLKKEFGR